MARIKLWAQILGSCMPAEAKQITVPMRREDLEFDGYVIYCLCLLVLLSDYHSEYLHVQRKMYYISIICRC